MTDLTRGTTSRRQFLKGAGLSAAATALAGVAVPAVHAAEDHTIRLALVGCGGRGTGAVVDALGTRNGPLRLVAMADVFEQRLAASHALLTRQLGDRIDVPPERRFLGFDAYRQTLDCLRPGDVAIFATPSAFRWVHFGYAVEKRLNVFMEKSLATDGPGTRRLLALADESVRHNLKVGVGLMCRHCAARQQLCERIRAGQVGDLIALRAYRMHGPAGAVGPRRGGLSELLYQVQQFHGFLWAGGGFFVDWLIHNIDQCCWMKGAWPVRAEGSGGRQYRGGAVDQNFDHYSVEYTFADGTSLFVEGRAIAGCHEKFASYAHGSRGLAVISTSAHSPAKCRIYKGHNMVPGEVAWAFPQPEPNPYQLEWDHLIDAIRRDRPYNEAKRGAEASLVAVMGRRAAHTGQVVTFEEMLRDPAELAPGLDALAMQSPAPVRASATGQYPQPQPGVLKHQDY
jgi:predicted dehydrogenase